MSPAQPTGATTATAANAGGAVERAGAWLKRQPRRHLALFALLPVLVVVWLPVLTGRQAPATIAANVAARGEIDATPTAAAAPSGETARGALAGTAIAAAAAFEERVRELTRPFQPRSMAIATQAPAEVAPRAEAAPVSYSALVPSAILLSRGGEAVAIVQGRPCRVGDVVAGSTIVAIEERRVVYRDGARTVAADMATPALGGDR
jgi:hypothetical protein